MKTIVKIAVSFTFSFVMLFGVFASDALAWGDFSQSCYNSSISGSELSSTCYKADGRTPNQTAIDLNSVIENVDGNLEWQPDNFIETCRGTSLASGHILEAECKRRNQSLNDTSIDLDDHIANIDGTLRYE